MFFLFPARSRFSSCAVAETSRPDAATAGFWSGNGDDMLRYVGTVEAGIENIRSVTNVCCEEVFDRNCI